MRAFKLWNKDKTSNFNLSSLNVITTDVSGLGNKFKNNLYSSHLKSYLTSQSNKFDNISLQINFGIESNPYVKYREFMIFIQKNGRDLMTLEYTAGNKTTYIDVVLQSAPKSQITRHGILSETFIFERLTPMYTKEKISTTSAIINNEYFHNILPIITLKNRNYPSGHKIKISDRNIFKPNIGFPKTLNGVTIDSPQPGLFIINGTATASGFIIETTEEEGAPLEIGYYDYLIKVMGGLKTGSLIITKPYNLNIPNTGYVNQRGYNQTKSYVGLQIINGAVYNDFTFYIQIIKPDVTRNLALPNLKKAKSNKLGEFLIFDEYGMTITYDVATNEFTLNGTNTLNKVIFPTIINDLFIETPFTVIYTETISSNNPKEKNFIRLEYIDLNSKEIYPNDSFTDTRTKKIAKKLYWRLDGAVTYSNYKFKIQIEKGVIQTPHVLPSDRSNNFITNGVDISKHNKNLCLLDLSNRNEYKPDEYIINNCHGLLLTYNRLTGIYTLNGKLTSKNLFNFFTVPLTLFKKHILRIHYVSGSAVIGPNTWIGWLSPRQSITLGFKENQEKIINETNSTMTSTINMGIYLNDEFHDYKFKIQLEEGGISTDYEVHDTTAPKVYLPTGYSQEIEINTTVTGSEVLIIDSENKKIDLNGVNAYHITNKIKNTFLSIPTGEHVIDSEVPIQIEYKKWVID